MSDSGKGDLRRPKQISDQEFANNWDRIFKKKDALSELGIVMTDEETQEYIERLKEKLETPND